MILKILRLPQVKSLTGLSRSTIYSRIAQDQFPKPISLGGRSVGFLQEDVEGWIQQRIAESRKAVRVIDASSEAA